MQLDTVKLPAGNIAKVLVDATKSPTSVMPVGLSVPLTALPLGRPVLINPIEESRNLAGRQTGRRRPLQRGFLPRLVRALSLMDDKDASR